MLPLLTWLDVLTSFVFLFCPGGERSSVEDVLAVYKRQKCSFAEWMYSVASVQAVTCIHMLLVLQCFLALCVQLFRSKGSKCLSGLVKCCYAAFTSCCVACQRMYTTCM